MSLACLPMHSYIAENATRVWLGSTLYSYPMSMAQPGAKKAAGKCRALVRKVSQRLGDSALQLAACITRLDYEAPIKGLTGRLRSPVLSSDEPEGSSDMLCYAQLQSESRLLHAGTQHVRPHHKPGCRDHSYRHP